MRGRRTFKGTQGGRSRGLRCEKPHRGFVYPVLVEVVGKLELNTISSTDITLMLPSQILRGWYPQGQ